MPVPYYLFYFFPFLILCVFLLCVSVSLWFKLFSIDQSAEKLARKSSNSFFWECSTPCSFLMSA